MPDQTDPFLIAFREYFDGSVDGLRAALTGVPPNGLNWKPKGDETNSLAVIATHAMGATRTWICVALVQPQRARSRDAEFVTVAAGDQALLAFIDDIAADCRTLLDGPAPDDWTVMRQPQNVTAASALVHAIEHLKEHVGQIALTRQLWDAS